MLRIGLVTVTAMPVLGRKKKKSNYMVNLDRDGWAGDLDFSSLYPGWFTGDFIAEHEKQELEELKKFNECSDLSKFTEWIGKI